MGAVMSKLLIDLDGTMINTPHFEAWCNAAYEFSGKRLTQNEYIEHIAGRPRMEGASRLLALTTDDASGVRRKTFSAEELAEYKQREFLRLSPATKLFDDALRLLKRIEESEQSVMFYTASKLLECVAQSEGTHYPAGAGSDALRTVSTTHWRPRSSGL